MDHEEKFQHSDSSDSSDEFQEPFGPDHDQFLADIVTVEPYRYEPYLDDPPAEEPSSGSDEDLGAGAAGFQHGGAEAGIPRDIQNVESWCTCGLCEVMPTLTESICCHEQDRVSEKRDGLQCIVQHPGFEPVCLNEYGLEVAHINYQDQYGENLGNEWKRYTAYRQFVRWCYGHLGKEIRVPLPACVVSTIRRAFSSPNYTGFMENRE
ncbi:uncharacterized protein LOC118415276 [Branchiostoma floridae]|uniref:Uncharacterized protein LOC118415276 n=2 Tax=Branchiostoma floridae TaxID=7739 RepID=A0A9J7L588_BRAFL|nr:uncharacterized protein LOC118415276 [Branchiostoma floridae]